MKTAKARKIKQSTYMLFTTVGNGVYWLFYGILPLLHLPKISEVISLSALFLFVVPQAMVIYCSKERYDELAKEHDRLAMKFSFHFTIFSFMFMRFLMFLPIIEKTFSCKETISFALSILFFSYGIAFIVLEKRDSYSEEENFEKE